MEADHLKKRSLITTPALNKNRKILTQLNEEATENNEKLHFSELGFNLEISNLPKLERRLS